MNLYDYQIDLLGSSLYAASPLILKGVGWRAERSGHVVINKDTNGIASICVVACVSDQGYKVTPDGNFYHHKYGAMSNTKFKIQLGKPYGTPFAADFNNLLLHLGRIETQVADTKKHYNLIVPGRLNKNLHLTRNIFKKRVRHSKHLQGYSSLIFLQDNDIKRLSDTEHVSTEGLSFHSLFPPLADTVQVKQPML